MKEHQTVSRYTSLRRMRLECFLLIPLVASCGSGFAPLTSTDSTAPALAAQSGNARTPGGLTPLPAQVVDPVVEIAAVKPLCCEDLERDFDVTIDGHAPPAGAVCRWDFGDNRTGEGCTLPHRYIRADVYEVSITVALSYGDELTATVELDLSGRAPTDGTGTKSLKVYAGQDVDAQPGDLVQLDGTVVTDYGPLDVAVTWTQIGGPAVTILDAATAHAWIELPADLPAGPLQFRLTATTNDRAVSDTITVSVNSDAVTPKPTQGDNVVTFVPGDATDAIQEMIDSGLPTVVIPNVGEPWIVRPLFLRSDLHLILEPGVVLQAKANEFHGEHDSLLSGLEVENVFVEAYDATIRMNKTDYASDAYQGSEWRHGVVLQGANNVEIAGLTVEASGGDGMYIGPTWDSRRVLCSDVTIHDCVMNNNYRNGMAIVAADNLLVEDCVFSATSGTAPQAGLLVEPGDRPDSLRRVRVRNCLATGNAGTGFMTNLTKHSYLSDPVDVIIEDCTVKNSVQPGLRAILEQDIGATGRFEFRRCHVDGVRYEGAKMIWDISSPVALVWTQCTWKNVAQKSGSWPVRFELTRSNENGQSGGIAFDDCRLENNHRDTIVQLSVDGGSDAPEVAGNISVSGTVPDELSSPRLPNLEITDDNPSP